MLRSTPKFKENESRRSRRSSILKPRKPRKPLQNVDFDSPRNETSSTPSKTKRRVSFADKKHVKEFCHTVEQGTVWDNTYEENDSAKGSFVGDANAKTESRENKSAQPSKDATLNIIACNTSEKYMETSDEKSQLEENMTNIKSYSCGNADFELDGTCIQDLSMEFTASIPTPSLAKENINIKDSFTLRLNLDTNYVSNSNNVSVQAVPVSARAVNSGLSIFEQISKIQNCESANWSAENNMHAKTVSSKNLHYSNIASESTFFKQTQDATQNINESMVLTNVIQPATTDMSCANAPFNVSMEMTAPISLKIYDENISQPHGENIINENGLRENQIDKTEFFNDTMETTKPVNVPLIAYDKENLRMDELILSKDDGTIFFHNASMEMTTVPLRNQGEITCPIIHKPISEENICKEKNADNSIDLTSEKTKLLCKSMEFTEAVPVSLHEQTLNPVCTAESTSFFQTISKVHSPAENSKLALQVDTTANETIQHTSMELTAPVSNLHFTQNARNERENLNISKDDGFQPLSVSTNNLLSPNKTCKSFMESSAPQESNVHLEKSNHDIYMNNTEHSERFVNTINCAEPFRLNFEDNLNDTSECSLLRKTLENGVEELQTIEPPSFISLDTDKEENSFSDALCKDKLQMETSEIDETINNICNSSNQLVINNITQATSRNSVAKDNESCTTLRENESINIKNQMEDDCSKNIANETEYNQEVDYQVLERTIINGSLINEFKHCEINVKNLEENISIQNNKCKETKIDNYESPIIKGSEIIAEEEYIREHVRERINDNPRNKEKEQYSDVQKLLIEQCTDSQREVIGNQLNSEEYCKENLINDAVKITGQNEENTEEQCADAIEESLAEQDPFASLSQELETYSKRDDYIWNVYHENVDRKMIVFGFISNSLLVAMFLPYDFNCCSEENLVKRIKIVSRISNDSGLFTKIVHKLILEKLDAELLMDRYKTREDILPMLEYVSQNVKLAMDFMFELKRLDDINLMEINCDQISFVSRSKNMDIIVKVIIKVKRFDELTSSDVNIHCLLGTIKETDVKGLIKNIKKDHMFLRKYMNDVKDYVDIIEMTMPKKCNY